MTNQSLVAVPPNVENPLVLRRYLSRLVEQLDIVVGNRSAPASQYVSQQELLVSAAQLTKQLNEAKAILEASVKELNQTGIQFAENVRLIDLTLVELEARVTALEASVQVLEDVAAIKAVMLTFTVDGPGEPDISVNFNIDASSATRISTGLYEFELDKTTFNGTNILDNIVTTLAWAITPDATSELFQVEFVPTVTPGIFRLQVNEFIVGVGNKLSIQTVDLAVGDLVSVAGLLNIPGTSLP